MISILLKRHSLGEGADGRVWGSLGTLAVHAPLVDADKAPVHIISGNPSMTVMGMVERKVCPQTWHHDNNSRREQSSGNNSCPEQISGNNSLWKQSSRNNRRREQSSKDNSRRDQCLVNKVP